jgi:N utilization substance protein B
LSSRHRSREVALQALYALDVARLRSDPDVVSLPSPQEAYEGVAAHFEMPEGSRAFAKELVISVSENRSALDEAIAEQARNRRVSRMAAVDRNVLRLGAFELIYTETPIGVILDEAVELARRFGSDTSPAFVNGILDAIAHAVRKVEP